MCILSIDRVQVSRELLLVFGSALGGDCNPIAATLELVDAAGQPFWTSTQAAEWIDVEHWQATLPLSAERRRYLCESRFGIDPPRPGYRLRATCDKCVQPAQYSQIIECCPAVEKLKYQAAAACEDRDKAGLLLHRLKVQWAIARRSAGGDIDSQANVDLPSRSIPGQVLRLAADTDSQVFEDEFFVASGEPMTLRIALVGFDSCTGASKDIAALPACDCAGQPASTKDFVVLDENGDDLSQTVVDRRCVNALRVNVQAPPDARAGHFEWVSPAQADADDPFATTVGVPDTDEGVEVVARIGSAPCMQERSVTIKRCQARPPFCGFIPFSCAQVEATWMIIFYVATFACYVGISLLSSTATAATVEKAAAAIAAVALAIGMGFALAGIIAYLICFFLIIYWLLCCSPRSPCRFLRSFSWLLFWIGFSLPFWALLVLMVGLITQLKFYTLAGIGVGSLFSFLFTVLLAGGVMLAMHWFRCPIPNPWALPPVLAEDSP
jgi:hypothetical protein